MPNEISGESRKIARLISLSFFSKKEEAGLLSEISGESRKISHLISLSFFSKKDEAGSSRQRRVCRVGAGVETVAFSNNTPGFPSCVEPSIVQDIRGFKKLQMPRNHPRIMQTSLCCVGSWQANCDIQILLYDSDPLNPSPADIAKATDYIVGYACKGNESLKTEKLHMTSLILQSHEVAGDDSDVIRVARQLLNQTVGNKMISKQECMVHLGQLRLFECSETISNDSYCFDYSHGNDIPEDLQQLIQLINTLPKTVPEESNDPSALDFGLTYDWSTLSYPVSFYCCFPLFHLPCFSHAFK